MAAALHKPAEDDEARVLYLDLIARHVRVEVAAPSFAQPFARCFAPGTPPASEPADLDVVVTCAAEGAQPPHGAATAAARAGAGPPPHPCGYEVRYRPPPPPRLDLPARVTNALDLCGALNRWAVAVDRTHCVFHAGAVSRDGRAILLPAVSGSGKSTVTAGLVRRGFALLTDEVAAVRIGARTVQPYPRSLCLRDDVLGTLGIGAGIGVAFPERSARVVRPEDLGGVRACTSAPLAMVVSPRYAADGAARLERLSATEATAALLQSCCSQARLKVAGLDWLIDVARRLPCHRLTFSRLDDALDLIVHEFRCGAEHRR